jgi:molybdopterin molybdotransferase
MDISRKMVSVEEAEELIFSCVFKPQIEEVDWSNSLNRITVAPWTTKEDLPSFHRVMMDGYAIRFHEGVKQWNVQSLQRAGEKAQCLENSLSAIEIMTGAILPEGTDTVVPYEHVRRENTTIFLEDFDVKIGQNVHERGRDKKAGDEVLPAFFQIRYTELGLAASIGKLRIRVLKRPDITILSTGDELVKPHEIPESHQIRMSNAFLLQGMLQQMGIDAVVKHIRDHRESLNDAIQTYLSTSDILLLSGGVSKGKYDLVPEILEYNGVEGIFHGIKQRPGKPMWMGRKDDKPVFGFPGNPVSTLVCARRYFLPWLQKQYNMYDGRTYAQLGFEVQAHPTMTLFIQVKRRQDERGGIILDKIPGQGSGDFAQLSQSHGFAEIPSGTEVFPEGSVVKFWMYS